MHTKKVKRINMHKAENLVYNFSVICSSSDHFRDGVIQNNLSLSNSSLFSFSDSKWKVLGCP